MIIERWAPHIGDPTLIGWFTTFLYLAISLVCLKAASTSTNNKVHNYSNTSPSSKQNQFFWLSLTLFLIFFGINKQMDFQTLITQIGREISISQGWYENRRSVHATFITIISLFSIAILYAVVNIFKNSLPMIKTSLIGILILFLYYMIRASSFHHINIFDDSLNITLNYIWLLELCGLILISIGGIKFSLSKTY